MLPGRSCSGCTLCCKVLSIAKLAKPQGQWCPHAQVGRGCLIYPDRPSECATFYCGYLTWPMAGDHWLPAKCKMVIVSELNGGRIAVHVDPGRSTAWREQPFYNDLKEWAQFAVQGDMQVVVCIGNRVTVILPDRDVDLGPIGDDERIITGVTVDAAGNRRLEALKLHADDPRIAGLKPGVPFRRPI